MRSWNYPEPGLITEKYKFFQQENFLKNNEGLTALYNVSLPSHDLKSGGYDYPKTREDHPFQKLQTTDCQMPRFFVKTIDHLTCAWHERISFDQKREVQCTSFITERWKISMSQKRENSNCTINMKILSVALFLRLGYRSFHWKGRSGEVKFSLRSRHWMRCREIREMFWK